MDEVHLEVVLYYVEDVLSGLLLIPLEPKPKQSELTISTDNNRACLAQR